MRVQVAGQAGVPASGVAAVALQVGGAHPTNATALTVAPSIDHPHPPEPQLWLARGRTGQALVLTQLGPDGSIQIGNRTGSAQVSVAVCGWVAAGSPIGAGGVVPLTPARVFDGWVGRPSGPAQPSTVTIGVAGCGGVPAEGVQAVVVVVVVTASQPSQGGWVAAYQAGIPYPGTSTVNYQRGETAANLALVRVGAGGQIALTSSPGRVHLAVEVVGWVAAGEPLIPGGLTAATPHRELDTRVGLGGSKGPVGPGNTVTVTLTGTGQLPTSEVRAVALNLTVTQPTAAGGLTVFAAGQPRPSGVENLVFAAGQTVANAVLVPVAADGTLAIYNRAGRSHLVLDVLGWVAEAPTPATTTLAVGADAPTEVPTSSEFDTIITVTNAGPNLARQVQVTSLLPAAGEFLSSTPAATPADGRLTVPLGELAVGATGTVTVRWRAPVLPAQLRQSAQASADNAPTVTAAPTQTTVIPSPQPGQLDAPPLPQTGTASLAEATRFLYEGPEAIQTAMVPGTIQPARAAVVRGRLQDGDGHPLAGVTVNVRAHPEYGHTQTRPDGFYDLAVNGGGQLELDYAKPGLLGAQRKIQPPPGQYTVVDPVVLVALDPAVTAVDLASPEVQVVRGSPQHDEDGTRQATLLVNPGTAATMTLPDGTTQPLSQLQVRATEFTVGDRGPQAMPGELPAPSGYTYAVEYSVDEALAAGATTVRFDRPMPFYVENFVGFPVGDHVPVGYYDRDQGRWIPADDGRVIKLLAVTDGMASLDLDGDGTADDEAALAALGIDQAERRRLAELYAPGQSLWRVLIDHFTPWDCNWPYGPPDDARGPDDDPEPADNPPPCPDTQAGSMIGCQDQSLGEQLPLVGIGEGLHYSSRRSNPLLSNTVRIPLTGPTLPGPVLQVKTIISVAGQRHQASYPPTPNQSATFTWDGRDGYGRPVAGRTPIQVQIGYVYKAVYQRTTASSGNIFIDRSFGRPGRGGKVGVETNRAALEIVLWRRWTGAVGPRVPAQYGIGGWALAGHHYLDTLSGTVELGSGGRLQPEQLGSKITTTLGGGSKVWLGIAGSEKAAEGLPALDVKMEQYSRSGLAVGPDGSIAFGLQGVVFRIDPTGRLRRVAGIGSQGFSGDGGPALNARISTPHGLAYGPDGSLYIAENTRRVRRIDPAGIISTVAGTGEQGFSGDGGPATAAKLTTGTLWDLAVGPDGTLHLAVNCRIRAVGPDGIITTEAGGDSCYYDGDDGPATAAMLHQPLGLALGPDGSLYVVNQGEQGAGWTVRRISPNGIITRFAGGGTIPEDLSDGQPATSVRLSSRYLWDVTVGPDGSVYLLQDYGGSARVRVVTPDGRIHVIAGTGKTPSGARDGDNGPALAASFGPGEQLTLGPDGRLHVITPTAIRTIHPRMAGLALGESLVAAPDGSQLWRFDAAGRHLQTLDPLTNTALATFAYDPAGRLTTVRDDAGNTTTIHRDPDGNPTAIHAPFGQQTTLQTDSSGRLASVTNPARETIQLTSDRNGLLTSLTDPAGATHRYTYDATGRLVRDEDPAGGTVQLTRTGTGEDYTVTTATAEGRVRTYRVQRLPDGAVRQTTTSPSGATTVTEQHLDATATTTLPCGTVSTVELGPDPQFGMQAPVVTTQTLKLPSGLTRTITSSREVQLNDDGTLATRTHKATINGRDTMISTYDAATRTLTTISPAGRSEVLTLDEHGRPISARVTSPTDPQHPQPPVEPVTYDYDEHGRLHQVSQGRSDQQCRSLTYAYDSAGQLASITDEAGRGVRYGYDPAGRLTQTTLPSGRSYRIGYDQGGNPTTLTMPSGAVHTFTCRPDRQFTGYTPPGGPPVTITRNRDDQHTQTDFPDHGVLTQPYDAGGRLAGLAYPGTSITIDYAADADQPTRLTRSDGNEATQELTLSYDWLLVTGMRATGPAGAEHTIGYNDQLLPDTLTLAGTEPTQLQYDLDGLRVQQGPFQLHRHGPAGALDKLTGPSLEQTFDYDPLGRLQAITHATSDGGTPAGSPRYHATLDWDNSDQLIGRTETIAGETSIDHYRYDPDGQLIEASYQPPDLPGQPTAPAVVERYAYDANGNRTSRQVGDASPETATYDAQDWLVRRGDLAYEFDAAGFLTRRGSDEFAYSNRGELRRANVAGTEVSYGHDPLGRRVTRTQAGRTLSYFYGDPSRPLLVTATRDQDGILTSYHYDSAGRLFALQRAGMWYSVASDPVLGSPRVVTSGDRVIKRLNYDPWGAVTADTNPDFELAVGFAGGLTDATTGLVRFGARDYEPASGRWTGRDPAGFSGGANLYAYVNNAPAQFVDQAGMGVVDYVTVDVTFFWIGFHYSYDFLYGEDYVGREAGTPGVSVRLGWLQPAGPLGTYEPSREEVAGFHAGHSINVCGALGVSYGRTYVPGSSYYGEEVGVGARGLGASYAYSQSVSQLWSEFSMKYAQLERTIWNSIAGQFPNGELMWR